MVAIFFIGTKGGMIMLGKDFENIIGYKTLIAVNNIKNKQWSDFDVLPLSEINIVKGKGKGCYVYDNKGIEYLDLYCWNAVISIGHSHPYT